MENHLVSGIVFVFLTYILIHPSYGFITTENLLIQTALPDGKNSVSNALTDSIDNYKEMNSMSQLAYISMEQEQLTLGETKLNALKEQTPSNSPKPDYPSDCPTGTYFNVDTSRGKECLPCIPDVDIHPECNTSTNSETSKHQIGNQANESESNDSSLSIQQGDPIPDIGQITITEEGMPRGGNPSNNEKEDDKDVLECEKGITITSEDIEKTLKDAGCK